MEFNVTELRERIAKNIVRVTLTLDRNAPKQLRFSNNEREFSQNLGPIEDEDFLNDAREAFRNEQVELIEDQLKELYPGKKITVTVTKTIKTISVND